MKRLETDQYTIRPIERYDADIVRTAVMESVDRLKVDFPHLAAAYDNESDAFVRVSSLADATADEGSGFNVYVATDPEGTVVYGVGTRDKLKTHQQLVLGGMSLKLMFSAPYCELVAGWTTSDAPENLALDGLRLLSTRNRTSKIIPIEPGDIITDVWLTLIRPDNFAAINLATSAGMQTVKRITKDQSFEVNKRRARLAGIKDGVKQTRDLYYKSEIITSTMLK